MKSPRILCCGNLRCGDDAAGIEVGLRLRSMGVDARVIERDAFTLLEEWRGAEEVLVVDAVVNGAKAGTITIWEVPLAEAALQPAVLSTHLMGVAEAIAIGRNLGRLPQRLVLFGIEAGSLEPSTGLSDEVARAVEEAARRIADRVRITRAASL